QPRQRPLMQKAGEIIGAVREQLAAAEPDKEVEVLALDALSAGAACRLGERRMRQSKRGCIATHTGKSLQQRLIGSAREQACEQRVFLRPRRLDLIEIAVS